MKTLKILFLITDIGFIIYWLVTFLELIPNEYLFNDYNNPILVAWNWSFFPLDILVSITGLTSLYLYKKGNNNWSKMALISLVLTFCAGLQAISFWAFSSDFDITWWIPNLFLLIYPLFFIPNLLRKVI
ncbi:YvaD family protein [Cytobacillus solani]|uniref:YvaD family protein n=1 Tax=Cytobacillus solani TaxID=1637975 RepID=A0A0Q3QLD0_9BACI|nr:YvaD family protein [Cytobacillus solani]KOP81862.1 hypothetical protein AMS60_04820 [Bacillus sp. FJAT-21945]KQL18801.1 hypothetical protein AN957_09590 [Cytobacillus solani]USK57525.1 YvaD family protein [Cytobacillus solani]